ncbi:hypothetical protein CIPAW_09G210800 [Carya illinoinensis]|uniref:DOG1 domain-containing protein n=1 Tax=Carya illinoinensis TaxID=32201 RepID=A0A8T1PKL4_CARIL|nr:hypothetical protein CIPAW_09G210800 [Carya illinoinensis]
MPKGQGIRRRNTSISNSFEAFLEGWLQHCHKIREEDLKDLVSRILAHYQEYYDEKSRVAQRDIFLLFSPIWLTSLEHTFLWISSFKPSLTFQLITNSVDGLSEDQIRRIDRLTQETMVKKQALNHELRSDEVLAEWKLALGAVLANADELRTNAVLAMVEIMRPTQSIRFLAAAAQLQLRIRTLGLQREAETPESSGGSGSI